MVTVGGIVKGQTHLSAPGFWLETWLEATAHQLDGNSESPFQILWLSV